MSFRIQSVENKFNAKALRCKSAKRTKGANMENELSHKIIGAAIEVHRVLGGPGLLESIYEAALCHEFELLGLQIQRQLPIQVVYKEVPIKDPFYVDILVNNKVIIEVKATEKNHPIYETQLLTYLRLANIKLGLLINFGNSQVKDGISRVVNDL
jgi:GxxExxY protein